MIDFSIMTSSQLKLIKLRIWNYICPHLTPLDAVASLLVEQLPPTAKVRGSNPVINVCYSHLLLTVLKRR